MIIVLMLYIFDIFILINKSLLYYYIYIVDNLKKEIF